MIARRALGRTGLDVSIVGLGAGRIGDPSQDAREVERLLHGALDGGVTLIDTARSYGLSEERIGRFLATRRDAFVLSTKVGYDVDGVPDWTGECVRRGIENALGRLRTDRIELVFLHSCPRDVLERRDVIDALHDAKRAGKIRCAGYSGENEELAWAIDSGAFDVVQHSVSVADQRVLDDALPRAAERGIGVLAKRPLANAAFALEHRPDAPDTATYFDRLRAMSIDPRALPWPELALRFSAFAPGVSSAIVGTARLENLVRSLDAASRGPLDPDHVRAIRDAFRARDDHWRGVI
ncbi:aldo/keto reductase [Sandaracinus amylolyticus]|uniref:Aldo/keto reductase n=1 Tax=Sandaracinus amylolyticus TaxID=927083 RepID=A0A0F6W2X9_9BACT|nr:aldo/keto reductase [Sandaracinus amylolyticus]AKF06112.1 aldo/keto reductase [Sandaracinus amylolyticus]